MTSPQLVVALDVADAGEARDIAARLQGHVDVLKVGLELFTAHGPPLVRQLVDDGWKIFLDLKVHDIPATARGAVAAASTLGVELLTLHASGGAAMMRAAVEGRGAHVRPLLLGVTVLTSMGPAELGALGIDEAPSSLVDRLCGIAHESGCDGVVASVAEATAIKNRCGRGFRLVTPGIRPAGASVDDQARVATPADAVRAGSDYLVVGRPILRAPDPVQAATAIRRQMESALEG